MTQYRRAPELHYAYVFCSSCRRAYPKMRDLEAEWDLRHGADVDAEKITNCPQCGAQLPPPIGRHAARGVDADPS